jgi:hypothetical protein
MPAEKIPTIFPQLAEFLENNPAIRNFYENVLGGGMKKLRALSRPLNVNFEETNYFGKALCYLINEHYKAMGVTVPYLMSASSGVIPDKQNFLQVFIFLTTPSEKAQYIVDYFNSLVAGSAELSPKSYNISGKKTPHTKLIVKNTVLTQPEFLAKLATKVEQIQTELQHLEEKEIDMEKFKSEYTGILTASTATLFSSAVSGLKTPKAIVKFVKEKPDSVAATVVANLRRG